ncbi:MAG: hypothetical protein K9G13_05805 [Aquiluna sp.]|nr:hypothetical protein [Aquiluna sp.]MCF8546033.1 hypothetical protein [Aquiluna sp.]
MSKSNLGVGRLLIAVYGVFALSASARAIYQLLRRFDEAPLAYSLSAISALVYILAAVALSRSGVRWQKIAFGTLLFELSGVLLVGFLSLVAPDLFAHPSVWSQFGIGYGFIPLALPILGLIWMRRTNARNN